MAIVISPSTLGGALTCPFKFYNSMYSADPRNVVSGALQNAAAAAAVSCTNNKLGPWLHYYDNYINPTVEKKKQLNTEILKKGMGNIYKFIKQYTTEDYQLRQEQKLEYKWEYENDEDVWISGTPDVIIIYNNPNPDDGIVAEIIDIKSGKKSRYEKNEIRTENAQRYTYIWLVFLHRSMEFSQYNIVKPKIKFSFAVADKGTGELGIYSKTLDEDLATLQMKHHIKEFRDMQKKGLDKKDYPATKCRGCAFCELIDICPLKKENDLVSESDLDELF